MKPVVPINVAVLLTAFSSMLYAQTAVAPVQTQAAVSFHFERSGLPVPKFDMAVREDGSGTYRADVVETVSAESATQSNPLPQHVERAITLSPATAAKIFKAAGELNHFNFGCASKAKNIANTGMKTLSYVGADGTGSCVYNYSENKDVVMLTDTFEGIGYTLDEGRRLAFLHRYDRLGLDAEINTLADEAQAGRALELGTITPTLTAIVGDVALIQRVRLRAAKMLEQAKYSN